MFEFFNGHSQFKESVVGWAGHTENGSSIRSVEGLNLKVKFISLFEASM